MEVPPELVASRGSSNLRCWLLALALEVVPVVAALVSLQRLPSAVAIHPLTASLARLGTAHRLDL